MLASEIEAHVDALFGEADGALQTVQIVRVSAGAYDPTTHKIVTTEMSVSVRAVVSVERKRGGPAPEIHPGSIRVLVRVKDVPFVVTPEHLVVIGWARHKIASARIGTTGTTWVISAMAGGQTQ